MTFFRRTAQFHHFFCHFQISLICLIHLSLLNLHLYTIRSITMFLKVVNKVDFKVLAQLFLTIDLLLFSKLFDLQLLITVHLKGGSFCSSVVEVLPCSDCFITCMRVHFPTFELDNAIWFSTFSRKSGLLWHSSKWSCWFGCFLQYTSGI